MADRGPGTELPPVGALARLIGKLYLRLFGWRTEGTLPHSRKGVLIAAPHTSNWDMPHMLAVAWSMNLSVHWLGKRELFRFPFGGFMRFLGGVSIDRRAPGGVVAQVVERLRTSDGLAVVVPPSGTRKGGQYWKSGFYHIAYGAQVPILPTFLDYKRKVGGCGPSFVPTGNIPADMDRLREFYKDITPKKPEAQARIRLKEEDEQ